MRNYREVTPGVFEHEDVRKAMTRLIDLFLIMGTELIKTDGSYIKCLIDLGIATGGFQYRPKGDRLLVEIDNPKLDTGAIMKTLGRVVGIAEFIEFDDLPGFIIDSERRYKKFVKTSTLTQEANEFFRHAFSALDSSIMRTLGRDFELFSYVVLAMWEYLGFVKRECGEKVSIDVSGWLKAEDDERKKDLAAKLSNPMLVCDPATRQFRCRKDWVGRTIE